MDRPSCLPAGELIELWVHALGVWYLHESFDPSSPEFAGTTDPTCAAAFAAWRIGSELCRRCPQVCAFALRRPYTPQRGSVLPSMPPAIEAGQAKQKRFRARDVKTWLNNQFHIGWVNQRFMPEGKDYQVLGTQIVAGQFLIICEEASRQCCL